MRKSLFYIALALAVSASSAPREIPCQKTKRVEYAAGRLARPAWDRRQSLDQDSVHAYDMLALELDYRVENNTQPVTGTATITLVARETAPTLIFNAEGLTILGANENDSALPFSHENDTLRVTRPMQAGDTVTIWFSLSVPVRSDHVSVGLHWGIGGVFTFSEPYGARRWYPCFDQPFDKFSRVTVAVNMPDYWSLAANGERIETSFPETGRKREVYRIESPISSYLVMLACGEYSRAEFERNDIQYRYFVWPQDSLQAAYDWERTPLMVDMCERLFGPYPFQQYGMVQAELFNGWGAMEHQTFTTMGHHLIDSTRQYEGIVAHELAHQWFGDALSPVDFRNIWLNEGFATYGHALWFNEIGGRDSMLYIMSRFAEDYFAEDRILRYATYEPPPEYLFGTGVYQKAAWVLHMLREQLMGDSLFFAGMRLYTDRFRYQNVDTEDFITVMSEVYGQDLHWFFDQWIYSPGFPELEIVITPRTPTDHDATVRVRQLQSNAPLFRLPLLVAIEATPAFMDTVWIDGADVTVVRNYDRPITDAHLAPYQPLLYQGTGAHTPEPRGVVSTFVLGDPYPNPFNSSIAVPFELRNTTHVKLDIANLLGQTTMTAVNAPMDGGMHTVNVDLNSVAAGIYFARLTVGNDTQIKKLLLLK